MAMHACVRSRRRIIRWREFKKVHSSLVVTLSASVVL